MRSGFRRHGLMTLTAPRVRKCLTLTSPGFLVVAAVRRSQQPLSPERPPTAGRVPVPLCTLVEPAELLQQVVGDQAGTADEAVRVGQVRCRLPTGIS